VEKISVSLPRDMIEDIKDAIESGSYATTSEVLRDAMRAWQRTRNVPKGLERVTPRDLADLRRMVQEGVASADRGDVKPIGGVAARLKAKYAAMARGQKKKPAKKSRS